MYLKFICEPGKDLVLLFSYSPAFPQWPPSILGPLDYSQPTLLLLCPQIGQINLLISINSLCRNLRIASSQIARWRWWNWRRNCTGFLLALAFSNQQNAFGKLFQIQLAPFMHVNMAPYSGQHWLPQTRSPKFTIFNSISNLIHLKNTSFTSAPLISPSLSLSNSANSISNWPKFSTLHSSIFRSKSDPPIPFFGPPKFCGLIGA